MKNIFKTDKIVEEDIPDILSIINTEFPYTTFNETILLDKISNNNFFLIKIIKNKELIGFAEVEFISEEARLNAIFVTDSFRNKGIGKKLLNKCIKEIKRRKIKKIFLLVKESNNTAKKLYLKIGFNFEKNHNKIIDDSIIEVWSIKTK
jgi:[ribosomal protein S18]-alanine N-acetyltransferase